MSDPFTRTSMLDKKLFPRFTLGTLIILFIMGASLALHMVNIRSIGNANAYYTAAVEAMLKSPSNFFFIAAEPGGSVTVDKSPLGLWIEAVFAYFLGVSGFSVSLPNILSGVFGIGLLYSMVKKHMGELAGLVAGLVMAVTPIFLATNRNNTMDGILVFTLLVAAWAFIRATESGSLFWLLAGALITGLGFNVKMLQAFLPLPAFYALYFFGSKEGWVKKVFNLGIATMLLVIVSLSWAVIVDLVPPERRPYIGSSGNNTVMGLIFGHNGVSRLENNGGAGSNQQPSGYVYPVGTAPMPGQPLNAGNQPQVNPGQRPQGQVQGPPPAALEACQGKAQGDPCSFTQPTGATINGFCILPPDLDQFACAPQGAPPNGQGNSNRPGSQYRNTPFSNETGSPGLQRFFIAPLSSQMSWLLPFALLSLLTAVFGSRIQLPVEANIHKGLILWGGWLMTCLVFLSMVSGIFHAYYTIMLSPALGAMVGIGFAQIWHWDKRYATAVLSLMALLTLGFQFFTASQYGSFSWWMPGALLICAAGLVTVRFSRTMAYSAILASILIVPLYWSVMTVSSGADNNLPSAYKGKNGTPNTPINMEGSSVDTTLLDFLQANTQDIEYLVAVPSSQQGAELVLATGRPVLYMGGFSGSDAVVSQESIANMVADRELRYIFYGEGGQDRQEIINWLKSDCVTVEGYSLAQRGAQGQQGPNGPQALNLYDCGK